MKSGDLIFCYGTLRVGEGADLSRNPQVRHLGIDRINGKIYNLASFPGLKLLGVAGTLPFEADLPCVVGDVFEILDDSVPPRLDRYEGYRASAPEEGLYDRSQVTTEAGHRVWVYTINHQPSPDGLIAKGDWCYTPPPGMETVRHLEATTIAASLAGGAAV